MDYSVNMISNASLCTCRISRVQTALGWHDADDPPAWWCTVQVPVTTKVGSKQCLTQLLFNDLYIVTSHHHSELSRDSHVHTAAPVISPVINGRTTAAAQVAILIERLKHTTKRAATASLILHRHLHQHFS